jgi:integrase
MKINFYLTKSKSDLKPVKMFISLEGRSEVHTKQYVLEKDWNEKKQKVKDKVIGADQVNSILDSLKLRAKDIFEELAKSEFPNSKDIAKRLIQKKETAKPLLESLDEWTEESKSRISKVKNQVLSEGTLKRYKVLKGHLEEFEKINKVTLESKDIDSNFYAKFRHYMLIHKKNSVNTFSDQIKNIKTFCKWLQKKDPKVSNDFRDFEKPQSYSDAEPLKENELAELYKASFVGYKEKARLVFLFLCSTGMRISDFNRLNREWIQNDFLVFKAQKTNVKCYIPFFDDLLFKPIELFEKVIGQTISGNKLNDHIKEVFLELELTRIIPTSKTGRKTFATLKLLHGVSPEIIMKSTGHKSRSSFDAYVGIDTSDILKHYKDKSVNLKIG